MSAYLLVVRHLPHSLRQSDELQKIPGYKNLIPLVITPEPEWFANDATVKAIPCGFSSSEEVRQALAPYKNEIVGVFCAREANIQLLRQIIPHLPAIIRTPSVESLVASTDKRIMRRALATYAPDATPAFIGAIDASSQTVADIEAFVPYPVIVKPASLASSLLIQSCHNRVELKAALAHIFANINMVYAAQKRQSPPRVLVEEYLDGTFYSVDAYIMEAGNVRFCPPVAYTSYNQRGVDDFSLYVRTTPANLSQSNTKAAYDTTAKALAAVGLTWSSAHVELVLTKKGWKIIELGPRIGRYRHRMYKHAYGLDHYLNDVRVHLGLEPITPSTPLAYCAAYSFYPEKEGRLDKIAGMAYLHQNPAVRDLHIRSKKGDMCAFAKNGGGVVGECYVVMPDQSEFKRTLAFIDQHVQVLTT